MTATHPHRQTTTLPDAGGEPIATAAQIGSLLCTSGIPGVNPTTGRLGEGAEEQFALAFANARALLQRAGHSPDAVGQLTVFIPDETYRPYINAPWLAMFPTEDRPARKTTHTSLPDGQLVQVQAFAVSDARRQRVELPGLAHRDPLPNGVRMGELLFSSVLTGDNPESSERPTGEPQIEQVFRNMQTLIERAGGSTNDIALAWCYLGDFAFQPFVVETWVEMFPHDGDRPARKIFPYDLGGRTALMQAQIIGVFGGERTNYEVEGIGHHDPIPLGAKKGRYFFSSGISGFDPNSGRATVSVEEQSHQAMANLRSLLGSAGGSLDDVAHVTVLLGEHGYRSAVTSAWDQAFPDAGNRPALHMMKLGVSGRETLVQVHAVAVID